MVSFVFFYCIYLGSSIPEVGFLKKKDLGGEESTQASAQATQVSTQVSEGNEGPHVRETVYTLSELDLVIVNLMRKQPGISQSTMVTE